MQSLDAFIRLESFDQRLETDLYFRDLSARLGQNPLEMERSGLGVWFVVPVNVDDMGHLLLAVPKDDQDLLGTSVFFQTSKGLTKGLIAGLLLRLLDQRSARFMTPDGVPVVPLFPHSEPSVENTDGIWINRD